MKVCRIWIKNRYWYNRRSWWKWVFLLIQGFQGCFPFITSVFRWLWKNKEKANRSEIFLFIIFLFPLVPLSHHPLTIPHRIQEKFLWTSSQEKQHILFFFFTFPHTNAWWKMRENFRECLVVSYYVSSNVYICFCSAYNFNINTCF